MYTRRPFLGSSLALAAILANTKNALSSAGVKKNFLDDFIPPIKRRHNPHSWFKHVFGPRQMERAAWNRFYRHPSERRLRALKSMISKLVIVIPNPDKLTYTVGNLKKVTEEMLAEAGYVLSSAELHSAPPASRFSAFENL
jgi:hypothetical protein